MRFSIKLAAGERRQLLLRKLLQYRERISIGILGNLITDAFIRNRYFAPMIVTHWRGYFGYIFDNPFRGRMGTLENPFGSI